MKKSYIIPSTECVKVQTVNMIAGSDLHSMSTDGGPVSTNDTELGSGITSDSRRSLWDDEEEE